MVRFLIAAVIFLVSSSDITRAQSPSSEPQDSPPIIDDAVEQRTKLDFLSGKRPTREDVAKELVKEEDQIKEAERRGIAPTGTQVDKAVGEMCARMKITPEQLTKGLEARGIHFGTLRRRIEADLALGTILRLRNWKGSSPDVGTIRRN